MLDLFQAPIRVHLRPFAVKNRLPGPPEPPERPKWTANERKFTQMGRPDPVLARFHAFRGPLPVFSPPRTAYGFPTPDLRLRTSAPPLQARCEPFSAPKTPSAVVFSRIIPRASPHLRDRHYVAPPNRRKADLARVAVPPARALFPEPAAPCAVDPPPHFRYSLATQKNPPRHVKPT